MKITAHMIVKNEENFVWYAVNSVVNFVDGMMIWDQGSTDRTVEIVKTINNPKITLKKAFENVQILFEESLCFFGPVMKICLGNFSRQTS